MLLELHDLNMQLPEPLRLPTLPGVPTMCRDAPVRILVMRGRTDVDPLLAERDNEGL